MTIVSTPAHTDVAGGAAGTLGAWLLLGIAVVAVSVIFRDGLAQMLHIWTQRADYRHALLVLPLIAYLVWRRRHDLGPGLAHGSWLGFALVLAGLGCNLIGKFGSVFTVQQAGFMLTVIGIALVFTGRRAVPVLWLPALLLLLLVPLPNFVLMNLLAQLKTISVALATAVMRMAGVTVFTEGGVLTFALLKLTPEQVRDGLAYVVPLTTAGFLCACLVPGRAWKKALLIAGPVPLIVVANALVLAGVGVLADGGSLDLLERLLRHKGVAVGGMALAGMVLLAYLLLRREQLNRNALPNVVRPAGTRPSAAIAARGLRAPSILATAAALVVGIVAVALPNRVPAVPDRVTFGEFPVQIEDWQGSRMELEPEYAASLQLDDYLLADYRAAQSTPINFYVAWYDTQQAGRSVHSPNSCLPGEGWKIVSLTQVDVADVAVAGGPLRANRVVIELGGRRQLVYYWFQQRGRVMTNEYLVKWNLFQDGLMRNRSDGALVRVVMSIPDGSSVDVADREVVEFIRGAVPLLDPYVPL